MLTLEGISEIKIIQWGRLRPGMIILGGITINGSVPCELRGFPVLTQTLLAELNEKFYFLAKREVLVAIAGPGVTARNLSRDINDGCELLGRINSLRSRYSLLKGSVLRELGLDIHLDIPLLNSPHVRHEYLIKDRFNSFECRYNLEILESILPSLFHRMKLKMTLSELLTNRLQKKFNVPEDREVLLHLVVDYSKSMESMNKLDIVLTALDFFHRYYSDILKNTHIRLYVFSDECRPADYPLSGREMEKRDTSYASFMKKVLHYRDKNVHNKLILFTDGQPSDLPEALRIAGLIKKNRIDYTQIIFSIRDELRTVVKNPADTIRSVDRRVDPGEKVAFVDLADEELDREERRIFDEFTRIAETCGGNQIIVRINELVSLISIECYDRYIGMLTLATAEGEEVEEFAGPVKIKKEKTVRKWEFRKLP